MRNLVTFDVLASVPALCHHISGVIGCCSRKQMARSHTRSIVAGMKYVQSVRNAPVREDVGRTVSQHRAAIDHEVSVARWHESASPQPATAGRINPRPKPFKRSEIFPAHTASMIKLVARNIPSRLSLDPSSITVGPRRNRGRMAAAALTQAGRESSRLLAHREPPTRGATPPAVRAARGHCGAPIVAVPSEWGLFSGFEDVPSRAPKPAWTAFAALVGGSPAPTPPRPRTHKRRAG